ncbi:MAG: acyl-CoA dehydrogenase family protein [Pseudonocardiaceae bacterium]
MLSAVIERTVGPQAGEIDRTGAYPRDSVQALGEAGLLGILSAPEVGGTGEPLAAAAHVIEQLAGRCGSTAMVVLMHYAAVGVIEAHGPRDVRRAIARGEHVSSLAFSEAGSRSHFWAPESTATAGEGDTVTLDARKSWVTSAGQADSYVWSSLPVHGKAPRTESSCLPTRGDDGAGLDIALGTALPYFAVLNAAFSLGVMEALVAEAAAHLSRTRLQHLGQTLAQQPVTRAAFAQLRIRTDTTRAFLQDTLTALATGREDATLRVLQVKAVAAEAATEVSDGVLRLCGGAAFRKELGVERRFRDSLAARVMAPTTEALHDFVGRVSLGLPLFDS